MHRYDLIWYDSIHDLIWLWLWRDYDYDDNIIMIYDDDITHDDDDDDDEMIWYDSYDWYIYNL